MFVTCVKNGKRVSISNGDLMIPHIRLNISELINVVIKMMSSPSIKEPIVL